MIQRIRNNQNVSRIEEPLKQVLKELVACYPNIKVLNQTILCYTRDLSDLPIAVTKQAISNLRKVCLVVPTIAEIRKEAINISHKKLEEKDKVLFGNDCDKCYGTGFQKVTEMDLISNRKVSGVRRCQCRTQKAS